MPEKRNPFTNLLKLLMTLLFFTKGKYTGVDTLILEDTDLVRIYLALISKIDAGDLK